MPDTSLLSHKQTQALLLLAQQGDENAKEKLILCNTALVRSIIKKYQGRGAEYDDLFQIGYLGLIKAIKNFDLSLGLRFSTYAVPMIAGEIKRFLRDDGMVKVSRSLKELAARASAAQDALASQLGRDPGIREIASYLQEDPAEVAMAMESARPHISLFEPAYGEDSEAMIEDRVASKGDESETAINHVMLKELLCMLEPRERQIIMLRYFSDKTQGEIAKLLGVSQVQISRLENKILGKLRARAN